MVRGEGFEISNPHGTSTSVDFEKETQSDLISAAFNL
jgi:hypothetical protein